MAGGRPVEYNDTYVENTLLYLESCEDTLSENGKLIVKLPSIEGLADYLDIHKDTIYDWETKYEKFSDVIAKLRNRQATKLLNNGLSNTYNPTIAKVLLTKHGYREGIDQTTNNKDLPTPILNGLSSNDSSKEDSEAQ
jgi:hypothetical protein